MKAVGLPVLYPGVVKNPLPWMDNYLTSKAITVAPQESSVLSYVIGASNTDVTTDTFSNFEL